MGVLGRCQRRCLSSHGISDMSMGALPISKQHQATLCAVETNSMSCCLWNRIRSFSKSDITFASLMWIGFGRSFDAVRIARLGAQTVKELHEDLYTMKTRPAPRSFDSPVPVRNGNVCCKSGFVRNGAMTRTPGRFLHCTTKPEVPQYLPG